MCDTWALLLVSVGDWEPESLLDLCVCVCVFIQTTILIDWLIGTSCYSAEVGQNYAEKKVESVQDKQKVMERVDVGVNLCLLHRLTFFW